MAKFQVFAVAGVMAAWFWVESPRAAEWTVHARMDAYDPADLEVSVGDTVTWVNLTAAPHDLRFEGDPTGGGGDLTRLLQTRPVSVTVTDPGVYRYRCTWHGMNSVVRVKAVREAP